MNDPIIASVLARRSHKQLGDPGPSDAQLDTILSVATTVPDHGELQPWRFVVVQGEERDAFGAALEAAGVERNPGLDQAHRDKLRNKAFVAPAFVVIIFSPKPGKIDLWEQEASAASTGYAMALATHLVGLGAIWKSASVRTGSRLAQLFAMTESEALMGWVNVGTVAREPRAKREPVRLVDVASRLTKGHLVAWHHPDASGQS